ncbi:MAG: hypothetical protein KGI67_01495 [Pseudomonadota bacterium]|nr:hypothetical protein [Pseudomonadota bacterium]
MSMHSPATGSLAEDGFRPIHQLRRASWRPVLLGAWMVWTMVALWFTSPEHGLLATVLCSLP